ncbi:rhodanese-like domain-containing protein [Acidihalobacter prosperus]|uniref:Rhodanese-like domain-containing protein n=1 Tax=Acidihalobacter prosperus TaxID=160660 RepID=A0A1A6C6L1_9GAMM|nr:rhodanese-like domain-containing protein [Acidihalobacter prosperus]OBS10185.1 rhodanese-like domain-containing protein [Acidihalobacter prosperus]
MYGFHEVDAGTLKQWMEAGESVCLVDVRTPAEMSRGIIEGARLMPLHLVPVKLDELMRDGDARLVFYCQSGARSAQACAFVAQRHGAEVYNLRAGVMGWMSAGHRLSPPETVSI